MIEVKELTPNSARQWDDFVDLLGGSIYFRYGWREVFRRAYNVSSTYLGAFEGNELRGILPLAQLRMGRAKSFVSLPYLYLGGALTAEPEVEEKLYESMREIATTKGISRFSIRSERVLPLNQFFVDDNNYRFVLKLRAEEEETFRLLGHPARKNINKALKHGFSAHMGKEELNGYYQLYAQRMKELGTPCHSIRYWNAILDMFPENSEIITIRDGRTIIAGVVLLYTDRLMSDVLAISRHSYRASCVYHLLHWEAIKFAIRKGILVFDFERSQVGTGAYTFKKTWGAEPQRLTYYDTVACSLVDLKEKYEWARKLWAYQPTWLSKVLGPRIRKGIP